MELHNHGGKFAFNVVEEKPQRKRATITIGHEYIDTLYEEAIRSQKDAVVTFGFQKGTTPLAYIEQNFRSNILTHIQELIFTHCVIQFLYQSLQDNNIVIVGDPELIDIRIIPKTDAEFIFMLNTVALISDQRWKRIAIKTHERKHYKDLDRQVQMFLDEEAEKKKSYEKGKIALGDWVQFEISLHSKQRTPLIKDHKNSLWVHVSHEEDDSALHELFIGKKPGDTFFSESSYLQDYMSPTQDMEYSYFITVLGFVASAYFSLDLFRHHFSLKDDKEALPKLIEVFSSRHDLSLRREIIEAVLKQLTKQYFFQIPTAVIDAQSDAVLNALQTNPDYHVYKSHVDFEDHVRKLATKQLKEAILMDALGYQEKITVSEADMHSYLNLTLRPRTREFVYFTLPTSRTAGHDTPLPTELIKQFCAREKTLNHVIHTLSARKSRS